MPSNIIEFIDASLDIPGSKYDPVYDLNLEIKKGEFLGLCGTGHSGARTLCLMINGLAPHATGGRLRGHVLVKGLDTRQNPPKMLALHVGIVFDDPEGQFLGMTVEDHVAFAPENLNLPIPEIRTRVDWALESVGMLSMRHRSLTDLSGGQKQRLAIAAALSMRPDILVLSDVTFALDPIGANEVYAIARQLNKEQGVTIIILDQDTEKLCEYCDRLAVMDAGCLVAVGRPDEVFSEIPINIQHKIRIPQVTELFIAFQEKFGIRLDKIPVNLDEALTIWKNLGFILRIPQGRKVHDPISLDPIIQVKDLIHVYPGGNQALNNINLNINRGEFVALVGQNGSGKTTLVKHIIHLLSPTNGSLTVLGRDIQGESVCNLARKVGYVFQNPDQQLFNSSVEQELSFGPNNLGFDNERIHNSIQKVANALELAQQLQTDPFQLSRGERERVAVGSILTMGPDVLMLDEPTTGLYWQETRQMLDFIKFLNREEGLTIIMITHNMRLVSEYTDRAIVIADGEILIDDTVESVFLNKQMLEHASLCPPQITQLAMSVQPDLDYAILTTQEFIDNTEKGISY